MAKSTYVWLDQLSRAYGRDIRTLDGDPGRGARHARPLGRDRPVADRPVGALEGVRADQADARPGRRGRLGLLARRLRDRRATSAARRPTQNLRDRAWTPRHPAGQRHGPQPHGHRFALGHRAPGVVPVARRAALPGLRVHRPGPVGRSAGRDRPRGPLLGRQRRGGRLQALRPGDRRRALRLPRQRRHELPVERHGPAGLPRPGRPRAGHPDDPRRRPAVPDHPLRRRDGPRQEAHPAPVVAGARAPAAASRRAPSTRIPKAEFDRADAGRVLARGRRPGRRRGPRHAPAGRGVLAARGLLRPDARDAPRLQQRVHAHAPRRGRRRLPEGRSRRPSSSTRRSSSATSTS